MHGGGHGYVQPHHGGGGYGHGGGHGGGHGYVQRHGGGHGGGHHWEWPDLDLMISFVFSWYLESSKFLNF